MDPLSAGLAMGGMNMIGGYFSGKSQEKATEATNQMNYRIAQENNSFNERMANTAHQRQTKDLEAAGLNRILSVTQGSGASSPTASQATMQMNPNAGFAGAALSSGVNTGMALANINADLDTKDAQVAKTLAETANVIESKPIIAENLTERRTTNARQAATLDADIAKSKHESSRAYWDSTKSMFERDRSEIARKRDQYDLPRAKAESEVDTQYMKYNKTLDLLQNGIDAATSAINVRKVFQPPTVRSGSPQEKRALEKAGRRGLKTQ